MMKSIYFKILALTLSVLMIGIVWASNETKRASSMVTPKLKSGSEESLFMLDFVILKAGFDIKDRDQYDISVRPIAAKYGMKVLHSYELTQYMAGPLKGASKLNIWFIPNLRALKSLSEDSDYQKLAGFRDEIHDMESLTLYLAESKKLTHQLDDNSVFIDLVVMNKGFGAEERDTYEKHVLPIAKKYGMNLQHSFKINKKMRGIGPANALRLNLWSIDDPENMKNLSQDQAYQAQAEFRDKIHNMEAISLYMAKPGV